MAALNPEKSFKLFNSLKNFASGVLDLSFKKKMTIELLPLFYALLLLAAAGISLLIVAGAFWLSIWAGLIALLFVPLGFIVAVAIIRAALEYLVLAFGILETVNNMNRIPEQVDNLNAQVNHITAELNHVIEDVTYIRGKVDRVTTTVGLLHPALTLLSLPQRLMPKSNKPV